MQLDPDQHAQFERDGYPFFPRLFSREEVRRLNDACNVREMGSDAVRT